MNKLLTLLGNLVAICVPSIGAALAIDIAIDTTGLERIAAILVALALLAWFNAIVLLSGAIYAASKMFASAAAPPAGGGNLLALLGDVDFKYGHNEFPRVHEARRCDCPRNYPTADGHALNCPASYQEHMDG